MHNPPHPSEILKEEVLPELGLSVTAAAEHLGVSPVAFSRVVSGRAAVSAALALGFYPVVTDGLERVENF